MPTYIYSCENCEREFERTLPVNLRNSKMNCPNCSSDLKRSFSIPAVNWGGDPDYYIGRNGRGYKDNPKREERIEEA